MVMVITRRMCICISSSCAAFYADDLCLFICPCTALENFILFARRDEIFRISLDIPELIDVRLPLVNLTGASGLDWDDKTDKIFWTDVLQDTINSANSNVSSIYG